MDTNGLINREEIIKLCKELKVAYPLNYSKRLKQHYPEQYNIIKQHNENMGDISTTQMMFNYMNNILSLPICPATGNVLKFNVSKWRYMKFWGKGTLTPEFAKERGKTLIGRKFKKTYPNLDKVHIPNITYEELYSKFIKMYGDKPYNSIWQHLKKHNPVMFKQILKQYKNYKPFAACMYMLKHNMSQPPVCPHSNEFCTYVSVDRGFKPYNTKSIIQVKKARKAEKYKAAQIYDIDTVKELLNKYIPTFTTCQNLKQCLLAVDPNIVKTVIESVPSSLTNKFAEKVYILLNGNPTKTVSYGKLFFQSFYKGYNERFAT